MTAAALTAAISAQKREFSVFPTSASKLPAIRSAHPEGDPLRGRCQGECGQFGHGVYDATTDPERLAAMFEVVPRAAGYGVAGGRAPHHLIGLDLDRKNGLDGVARLVELAVQYGFVVPTTITVATPSGGLHHWLSGPPGVKVPNSVSRIAPGIDVRGSGGYLIGPGSWTSKGVYVLAVPPDTPVGQVPAELLKLLLPQPRTTQNYTGHTSARISKRINGLLASVLDARSGRRNDVLFWAACRMGEAVAEGLVGADEGRELLLAAAARIDLDYAEASASIDSAYNRVKAGR